jgi:hypothetical protein
MQTPTLERGSTTPTVQTQHESAPLAERYTGRLSRYQRWYWLVIPALAVIAYITVIRIGFIQDDFVLLYQSSVRGPDLQSLLPAPHFYFYRPLGLWFVWVLGWQLWGYNPVPFHIVGLLIHALSSLILALWLFEVTGKRLLGWLAGALFAVFPLHLEVLGWISAQWDALALLFGLVSLWTFTIWWHRSHGWQLYTLSVLFYALAIFTKESLLAFLPILPLSAWLSTPQISQKWRRLAYSLVPFCAILAFNVGLRFYTWGNIGGYTVWSGAHTDYPAIFWDGFITHLHLLLSPINTTLLGNGTGQAIGALSTVGILLGLIWHGRREIRLLAVAAAWIILGILPVIDLPVGANDLVNNRLLYLATAGYCIGIAALLYETINTALKWRVQVASITVLVLLLSVVTCWIQLRPWFAVTQQTKVVNQLLVSMIPASAKPAHDGKVWYPEDMDWYVQGMPITFQGVQFFGLGLREMYFFSTGTMAKVQEVPDAASVDLTKATHDAFAFRFHYDNASNVTDFDYAAGTTGDTTPPLSDTTSFLWDFRDCKESTIDSWQFAHAEVHCTPGTGLDLIPTTADPQMVQQPTLPRDILKGPGLTRLRVAVRYPTVGPGDTYASQWFWETNNGWNESQSRSLKIKPDQNMHIYLFYLGGAEANANVTPLRFDPINSRQPAEIQWIAIDTPTPTK